MDSQTDILIYVEDPGAANFVAGLPEALRRRGLRVALLANGKATEQLRALNETFEPFAAEQGNVCLTGARTPRLLVVGTSENVDSPAFTLIGQARAAGILSVGFVDGPSNADHRFRGRTGAPLGHAPDWIIVADDAVRAEFRALGVANERLLVSGHPRYDAVMQRGRSLAACDRSALRRRHFPGLADGQRVAVFLSELSDGVNPHLYHRTPDYSLVGRGDVDGRTEIVLEEVLDAVAALADRPRLVVRLHPKNTREQFATWADEIDEFSSGGSADDLLEMLYAADLVVGLSTILLMEAALAGCRTLSVLPKAEEADWLPSIALGLTPFVSGRTALVAALEAALASDAAPVKRPEEAVAPGALERLAGMLCDLAAQRDRSSAGVGR